MHCLDRFIRPTCCFHNDGNKNTFSFKRMRRCQTDNEPGRAPLPWRSPPSMACCSASCFSLDRCPPLSQFLAAAHLSPGCRPSHHFPQRLCSFTVREKKVV